MHSLEATEEGAQWRQRLLETSERALRRRGRDRAGQAGVCPGGGVHHKTSVTDGFAEAPVISIFTLRLHVPLLCPRANSLGREPSQ